MRAAALVAAAALAVFPLLAQAQSTGTTDLSSLMAEVAALEQEIQALTGSASTTASSSTAPAASGGMCPTLPRTLSLGASGPDVSALQEFLAGAGVFQVAATGYFGSVTQAAVEEWQAQNGVVSSGDASSTGYGVVGPKTRAAIETACGGSPASAQSECLPAQPPTQECSTSWQPTLDQNGCTIYYTCSVALPTLTPSASATTTTTTPTSTTICPVVPKPSCTGTVEPFGTDANGCVTSYECVL